MGSKTLFATDFPIYTITPFGKRRVVVTGGGGSAKTGVPNALVSTLYSKILVHRVLDLQRLLRSYMRLFPVVMMPT